jgi:hypothetical protein
MTMSTLSSEKEFEDFLRRCAKAPVRVQLEYEPTPAEVRVERAYDHLTQDIEAALAVGDIAALAQLVDGRAAA